jgi:hypothetical protein
MLTDESLLPVGTAIERVNGRRPHPTTCHRWRLRGVRGIKLETQLCGNRRMTSIEAVKRFNAAVTAVADGSPVTARTNRQREAAIKRAEASLDRAGV